MAAPIKVFVCYRKLLALDHGGQPIQQRNIEAEILHHLLATHDDYDPWIDNARLSAGMKWETEIYRQLLRSDVVVVLIGPGTSQSEWVRREIALANALGISLMPVGFDLTDEQMNAEVKGLSIDDIQWIITRNISLQKGQALLAELDTSLRAACAATHLRQKTVLSEIWMRQRPQPTKASDNQWAESFELPAACGGSLLHVTSGDLSKVRNIDAIANSENNYMQMARFFESQTISSVLRHRGARVKEGRYEDVIQQELDWQLRDRNRPVQAGEVFATSAGGPDSELAKVNKARVILHIAAVQAVDALQKVIPYRQPHQIESAVRGALAKMSELNDLSGIFSPPGSDQRAEQERLAAAGRGSLTSVLFPLLGTGSGGAETVDVIGPILDGLLGYLSDPDNRDFATTLRHVYLSAYSEEDLAVVTEALRKRLTPVKSD